MPRFISVNIEYLFYQIYQFFHSFGQNAPSVSAPAPDAFFFSSTFIFFSIFVTAILAWAVCYFLIKTHQYHVEYEWTLYNEAQQIRKAAISEENPKWNAIVALADSTNPSDWKIAVIDADKMLDDALVTTGVGGENLGDRLKNFDSASTSWLDDAWEAHKIRNRIAHEAGFDLSGRDTKKAISRYERVLRELRILPSTQGAPAPSTPGKV